jgi:DNA-binding SARP family transcriptional activator
MKFPNMSGLTSSGPGEDCQLDAGSGCGVEGKSADIVANAAALVGGPRASSADRGEMAPRTPLRLTLIGRFALWRDGQELGIAASGQRLIALLALRDRPVGRLHVAGTLWPDYSTERSLADLRTALWRVNQAIRQVIAATPTLLRLDADIEVDVHDIEAFARRLSQARVAAETVDLDSVSLVDLAGDLLPDWYDDWLQDEREGLRQTRLHALESLARRLSSTERYADAIQAALAAIRLEPLRETAHHTLIEIHLAEGNWSEARRQFQRCRRLLREELGVEPSDSMRLMVEKEPGQTRSYSALHALSRGAAGNLGVGVAAGLR